MEYDSETVAFCDRCEKQTTRVFPGMSETQIDNGLHVYASGYYGGFWDTMSFAGKEGCVRKYLPLEKKQKVVMGLVVALGKGVANLPAIGMTKIVPIDREKNLVQQFLKVGKVMR